MCWSFPSPVCWMKRRPPFFVFVRAPLFSTMVETRSDRCFYIYHRTQASRAKACAKSYDKWKRYTIPSKVIIVPKPKEKTKKSASMPARAKLPPPKSPPMTDTTIPLSSALKREMKRQIQYQKKLSGAFDRLVGDRTDDASTASSDES